MLNIEELVTQLDLRDLPSDEVYWAIEAFRHGDGQGFADAGYSNHSALDTVRRNLELLRQRGIYESALISAFVGCKYNNRQHRIWDIIFLLSIADRDKLRAAGSSLPGVGPFVVYRGVHGTGRDRRVRGLSWTLDRDIAAWFASRFSGADQAVYTATVTAEEVYCFYDDRKEREVICHPAKAKRIDISLDEIRAAAARAVQAMHEQELIALQKIKVA
jgi:hypothetical protein